MKWYSCSKAKLQQRLNLVHHSLEQSCLRARIHWSTAKEPYSHLLTAPLCYEELCKVTKREEGIWWTGKCQSSCTSTQWDLKNVVYAVGACSRTGGLSLQQGPEKGWRTSVSRGMASSPFERTPRELGSARILWNECNFQGRAFLVYQKELWCLWGGGVCIAVLQSCGNSHQADKSDESNSWIHLCWFLGVHECSSKHWIPVSASYLQDEQGRPEDQMELAGRFHSVISPEGATVGREVLNM